VLALAFAATLAARASRAAPCASSATALCLSAQRFSVEVSWKDFQGNTGQGQAVGLTADTGTFWFFSESNVELIVKVLDARAINNKFWVFFGALSNVEYTLRVTDSVTGAVKTYQNPSGQFASVGDTSAFDGSGSVVVASHETVVARGTAAPSSTIADIQRWIERAPAASAFTPCPDSYRGFNLAGCRFHIEAVWNDGHGQTGFGEPVQLTNDTGYFWFFNDTNVELMVKVLDARPINGKFWVFFGALSNVQYKIAVKDSVTGAYRTYTNPSGIFASVGDTGAFPGGYSVSSVLDSANAASADLDSTGGALSVTGADGTVFTLEVPPQALASPEMVTVTPVSRIDRFPFSGGLAAGVEIEPAGLNLMLPATLTIQPPALPPPDRTLPYSYSQGGEDFILYPRNVDTSSLRLPLVRLGGYGVGLGDQSDAARQAGRTPSAPLSPYLQQYAEDVFLRESGSIGQSELQTRGTQIYRDAYEQVVVPLLATSHGASARLSPRTEPTCTFIGDDGQEYDVKEGLTQLFGVIRQKQMMGIVDESGEVETGLQEAMAALQACIQQAFDRCVARTDPLEATWMLQLSLQLQALGEEDPLLTTFIEGGLLERCLRFEIDFESKIVEDNTRSFVEAVQRLKYRSQHVPLRLNYSGADNPYGRSIWEGNCSLLPEDAAYYYVTGGFGCTVTVNPGQSHFGVLAAWIGLPTDESVRVIYDPGNPTPTASATGPSCNIPDFPIVPFIDDYGRLHEGEINVLGLQINPLDTSFIANYWRQLRFQHGYSQNGQYLAKKSYERTIHLSPDFTLTEETWFFLKHTPDAPMPDCP